MYSVFNIIGSTMDLDLQARTFAMKHLPTDLTDHKIKIMASVFGQVVSVETSTPSGRPGFGYQMAYIVFESVEAVDRAVRLVWMQVPLTVSWGCSWREEHLDL